MKIKKLHSGWMLNAIFDAVQEESLKKGYVKW